MSKTDFKQIWVCSDKTMVDKVIQDAYAQQGPYLGVDFRKHSVFCDYPKYANKPCFFMETTASTMQEAKQRGEFRHLKIDKGTYFDYSPGVSKKFNTLADWAESLPAGAQVRFGFQRFDGRYSSFSMKEVMYILQQPSLPQQDAVMEGLTGGIQQLNMGAGGGTVTITVTFTPK